MHEQLHHEHAEQLSSYGIQLGVPIFSSEIPILQVPLKPHVFYGNEVHIIQPEEDTELLQSILPQIEIPRGKVSKSNGETVSTIMLQNVMVMLAHGMQTGSEDKKWRFMGTGKPVSDTVEVYEKLAKDTRFPPLDVVIACRPKIIVPNTEQGVIFTFSRRAIPYIRPETTAYIRSTQEITPQLIKDKGVNMVVEAGRWNDLRWWFNYWSHYPRSNNVPDWALKGVEE